MGPGGGLLLGGNALHADIGPEAPGSGFLGFLLCSLGQELGSRYHGSEYKEVSCLAV